MSTNLDFFEVFPWNSNLNTGHEEIDAQHIHLTELLNKLANALTSSERVEISDAFDELAAYAKFHFQAEEAIWKDALGEDDIWVKSHQDVHNSFLPKVLELKEENKDKPFEVIVEEIVKFLIRWLSYHIIDDDQRLAVVANARDQGMSLDEAKLLAEEHMSGANKVLTETVLTMYERVSSRTMELMRERKAREIAEKELRAANTKLEQLSITDQLTGLFNRRHFDNVLDLEIRRAARDQNVLTYVLFDLDFFKKLNDTCGHVAGDQALQKIGKRLLEICRRPGDFAFRVGGEEFAVLSMGQETKNEVALGEIIRKAVEDLNIPHEASLISDVLTTSVGVISLMPTHETKAENLLKLADKRLYRSKELGRNRVVDSDD